MLYAADFNTKTQLEIITILVDDIKKGEVQQIYLLSKLIKFALLGRQKEQIEVVLRDLSLHCEEGIKANASHAFFLLGWIHCFIYSNYNEAIPLFENAMSVGHAEATNARAYMYHFGYGQDKPDYQAAIGLYDRAIELGSFFAGNNRGSMYGKGEGDEINHTAAIAFYERGIVLGNPSSMYNRAQMYARGVGGETNFSAAAELFDQAIQLGNAGAMYSRAIMFECGLGSPPDDKIAVRLLIQAFRLGDGNALVLLGSANKILYKFHHAMVLENYTRAAKLLKKYYPVLVDELIDCYCNDELSFLNHRGLIDTLFKDSDESLIANLSASMVIALNTYEQSKGRAISNKVYLLSQINVDHLAKDMIQPIINAVLSIWMEHRDAFIPCAAKILAELMVKLELTESRLEPDHLKMIASIIKQNPQVKATASPLVIQSVFNRGGSAVVSETALNDLCVSCCDDIEALRRITAFPSSQFEQLSVVQIESIAGGSSAHCDLLLASERVRDDLGLYDKISTIKYMIHNVLLSSGV